MSFFKRQLQALYQGFWDQDYDKRDLLLQFQIQDNIVLASDGFFQIPLAINEYFMQKLKSQQFQYSNNGLFVVKGCSLLIYYNDIGFQFYLGFQDFYIFLDGEQLQQFKSKHFFQFLNRNIIKFYILLGEIKMIKNQFLEFQSVFNVQKQQLIDCIKISQIGYCHKRFEYLDKYLQNLMEIDVIFNNTLIQIKNEQKDMQFNGEIINEYESQYISVKESQVDQNQIENQLKDFQKKYQKQITSYEKKEQKRQKKIEKKQYTIKQTQPSSTSKEKKDKKQFMKFIFQVIQQINQ